MITAVATLAVSFMDMLQRQTIASNGEWHVLYGNVNKEQLEAIEADKDTKKLIVSRDVGYAVLEGSKNDYKPYLFVKEYNTEGFEQFPIVLSSGRLPQSADEVVISDAIASNGKVQFAIGDVLTLDIGQRFVTNEEGDLVQLGQNSSLYLTEDGALAETLESVAVRSLTIVGTVERPTWEPTWAPGYTIISLVNENELSDADTVNASVVLNKVNRGLYDHATSLAEQNGIAKFDF